MTVKGGSEVMNAVNAYSDYIKNEVLALEITVSEGSGDVDINGRMADLTVVKA